MPRTIVLTIGSFAQMEDLEASSPPLSPPPAPDQRLPLRTDLFSKEVSSFGPLRGGSVAEDEAK